MKRLRSGKLGGIGVLGRSLSSGLERRYWRYCTEYTAACDSFVTSTGIGELEDRFMDNVRYTECK